MAKARGVIEFKGNKKRKRPGVHSKNASRSQNSYKKIYRGQGR